MLDKHRKIKILYIITKSNWGGAQRYVFDMATNIAKNEYEVIVAFGGDGILKKKLENARIRTISVPNLERDVKIFSEWRVFFDLLKILKREQPNIVHLNSSKIGGLGAFSVRIHNILCRNKILKLNNCERRIKIIFTAHGFAYKEDRNIISKNIIKFLSWLTILFSHKTITVSQDDYKNAFRLFAREKITMIHNGISKIEFEDRETARNNIIKKIQFAPNLNEIKKTIWICALSELHKNKGLSFAIRAIYELIKKSYNISYFIIGEGEERSDIEQLIEKLELKNNVFLLGHIDDAYKILHAFDIFTLTSIKEGLPYTLLEAGLAELPTVASNIGGVSEIIEDKISGRLTRAKNSRDIKDAILEIINSKKNSSEYGKALREKVEQDFTIKQMIIETMAVYEK